MAITFVPCKDKEHAIACREMKLLYINFGWGWELAEGLDAQWVESTYNPDNERWPTRFDFGIALED